MPVPSKPLTASLAGRTLDNEAASVVLTFAPGLHDEVGILIESAGERVIEWRIQDASGDWFGLMSIAKMLTHCSKLPRKARLKSKYLPPLLQPTFQRNCSFLSVYVKRFTPHITLKELRGDFEVDLVFFPDDTYAVGPVFRNAAYLTLVVSGAQARAFGRELFRVTNTLTDLEIGDQTGKREE